MSVVIDDGSAYSSPNILQKNGAGNINSYVIIEADGTQHPLYYSPFTSGQIAGDGSGYMCSGCIFNNVASVRTTYNRNGIFNGTYYGEDPQGNILTRTYSGSTYTDTDSLGRSYPSPSQTTDLSGCASISSYPISNADVESIPGYGGTTTQIKSCYTSIPIHTAFNDSTYVDSWGNPSPWKNGTTVAELNTVTYVAVQSVILYDGSSWSTSPRWVFHYNQDQIGSGVVNYGDLTEVDLPTGGTIQYSYDSLSQCDGGYSGVVNMSRGVTTRTENAGDGSPAVVRTYSGDTVNDGANDTVYTFIGYGCSAYPAEVDYYSGTGSGRTLLKKVNTSYTSSNDPYGNYYNDNALHVINVLPTSIKTTLANGLVSEITKAYQTGTGTFQGNQYLISTGQVTKETESDWGNGAPGPINRCTATTYKTQQTTSYFNANLVTIPAIVSVYSGACGGTLMAQTTYGYDENSLAASNVNQQRDPNASSLTTRGNLTSVHRWLNTTGSTLNELFQYYDTGEKYQYTDAKGNTPTTYSYSNAYYGAYLTQTQLPTTGGIAHKVSAKYDLNSGLITSFFDQNTNESDYSYDSLFRMTAAALPGGGYVHLSYPSFTEVQKTVGLSSTQSTFTTYDFDGLGRPVSSTL